MATGGVFAAEVAVGISDLGRAVRRACVREARGVVAAGGGAACEVAADWDGPETGLEDIRAPA